MNMVDVFSANAQSHSTGIEMSKKHSLFSLLFPLLILMHERLSILRRSHQKPRSPGDFSHFQLTLWAARICACGKWKICAIRTVKKMSAILGAHTAAAGFIDGDCSRMVSHTTTYSTISYNQQPTYTWVKRFGSKLLKHRRRSRLSLVMVHLPLSHFPKNFTTSCGALLSSTDSLYGRHRNDCQRLFVQPLAKRAVN